MIKRILTLGIIGVVLAGGAAIGITGNVNHQKASNHVVLASHIKNTSKSKEKVAPISNLWIDYNNSYRDSDEWTYGVNNSNQAQSTVTNYSAPGLVVLAGVANANQQYTYGEWANYQDVSSITQPNLAGPNYYRAGLGTSLHYVTWWNEFNNEGSPTQQSTYYTPYI